jgi:hypothetical protein
MTNANDEVYDDKETAKRRDAALLRALGTPHKRQAEMKVGKAKAGASAPASSETGMRKPRSKRQAT